MTNPSSALSPGAEQAGLPASRGHAGSMSPSAAPSAPHCSHFPRTLPGMIYSLPDISPSSAEKFIPALVWEARSECRGTRLIPAAGNTSCHSASLPRGRGMSYASHQFYRRPLEFLIENHFAISFHLYSPPCLCLYYFLFLRASLVFLKFYFPAHGEGYSRFQRTYTFFKDDFHVVVCLASPRHSVSCD